MFQQDPIETWMEIRDFPGYAVSDAGRVMNTIYQRIMTPSYNQQGHPKVGMSRGRAQHIRSVAPLVAEAFLPPPPVEFDTPTPIHLNGDVGDCAAINLMWRPRWFAVKFHQQFKDKARQGYLVPIEEVNTGLRFANAMEAAMTFGILAEEIVAAHINLTWVMPTYQQFAPIQEPVENKY